MGCMAVAYCCRMHQKKHWCSHAAGLEPRTTRQRAVCSLRLPARGRSLLVALLLLGALLLQVLRIRLLGELRDQLANRL